VRFNNQPNIDGQLRVLVFATLLACATTLASCPNIRSKLLFFNPFDDRVPSPTESPFGLPRASITKFPTHFGQKQSSLNPRHLRSRRNKEVIRNAIDSESSCSITQKH